MIIINNSVVKLIKNLKPENDRKKNYVKIVLM